MPEVNEIRQFVDLLKKKLKNKNIEEINILKGRYKTNGPFPLYDEVKKKLPIKVLDVASKGKFIYFILDNDYYLFCTLGLSGGYIYKKNDKITYAPGNSDLEFVENATKNLNVEFKTKIGSIYFYDQLSFGTLKFIKGTTELLKKLKTIGPDIMDLETTFEVFKERIKKKTNLIKPIGNVLMNQKVISGIGNYLRADVLWMSAISPFRKVSTLDDSELTKIYKNVRLLTWGNYNKEEAIRLKIISKTSKLPSDYNRHFFVYEQEKDIKGNKVEKDELYEGSQKRSIYWSPAIQK